MNVRLIKALLALVPLSMLAFGSAILFRKGRTSCSLLQLVGSGCLVIVALTHLCEALHLFAWMHWGEQHSVGHYLDLVSAVLGIALFAIGYFIHALSEQQ